MWNYHIALRFFSNAFWVFRAHRGQLQRRLHLKRVLVAPLKKSTRHWKNNALRLINVNLLLFGAFLCVYECTHNISTTEPTPISVLIIKDLFTEIVYKTLMQEYVLTLQFRGIWLFIQA